MPVSKMNYKNKDITITWQPTLCIHSGSVLKDYRAYLIPGVNPG